MPLGRERREKEATATSFGQGHTGMDIVCSNQKLTHDSVFIVTDHSL